MLHSCTHVATVGVKGLRQTRIRTHTQKLTHRLWHDLNTPDQRVCFPIIECKSAHRPNAEQKTTIDTYQMTHS